MELARRGRWVIGLAVTLIPLTGCGGGGSSGTTTTRPSSATTTTSVGSTTTRPTDTSTTAPPSSTVPPSTTVPRDSFSLFAVLGYPDAFSRELLVVDGQESLVESYTYGEIATRFDLVNGEVVGSESIDPFPDGTLFPLQYSVLDIYPGATKADSIDRLDWLTFAEADAASLGLPDGTTVLTAGQLVVALLDDVVVYIEAFPLVPDDDGTFSAYLEGTDP